jgi:alpha-L-rhamnosidase
MKNPLNVFLVLTGLFLSHGASAGWFTADVEPTQLRCEYLENPLGIDSGKPRLSWVNAESRRQDARGLKQVAYQVLVASSEKLLKKNVGDLWDSGKVESDQSIHVVYAGKPLESRMQCHWKVRAWLKEGKVPDWSAPALWTMGLLKSEDRVAKWVGLDGNEPSPEGNKDVGHMPGELKIPKATSRRLPARHVRKEFRLEKKVARATAYFSGLGLSELYLNGQKVGDAVLSPGLTDYTKRVFYKTYDVTSRLRSSGDNVLGAILGNGRFYAPRLTIPTGTVSYGWPKMWLQLEVEYADGTSEKIVSDDTWKLTTQGPIIANNEYDGEEYEARREMPGWAAPGFDDKGWLQAKLVVPPGGELRSEPMNPIRVTGNIKPIAITEPKPGMFVYDFGQNFVGWCQLKVTGPAGTAVKLRFAETLKPDGQLYLDNIRGALVTDIYTLKGDGVEIYEPRFTYHGFRYVEATGFPGTPSLDTLLGRIVNDDVATTGEFMCSNPLINKFYQNVVWGVRGNYRSFPTDCPQRDERQAWLGDRSAESRGEMFLFDVAALYSKWVADFEDGQRPNGSLSDVTPAYWPMYNDNVTWPSCTVIIPESLLDQYADTALIARHYPSMAKWVDHMAGYIKDGLISRDNYGDWCVPPENPQQIHSNDPARKTSPTILATGYFCHCLKLMARYATLLNKPEDAARYQALARQLRTALNKALYNKEKGYYDNGSQTACVLPLAFDLVPDGNRDRVFKHLVSKIEGESKGHVGTGLIGGQWLCRVLTECGRPDLMYRIATNTNYPSWGYMVEKGATTVWELWNGDTANPAMNSGNHVMLVGDFIIWLYEDVAGIRADPEQPGFKHIIMHPHPVGDLTFAKASFTSMHGLIVSDWKNEAGKFVWHITIPANTTATLFVPAKDADGVTESGKPAIKAKGVKFLRMENGAAIYEAGSGCYRFCSKM